MHFEIMKCALIIYATYFKVTIGDVPIDKIEFE